MSLRWIHILLTALLALSACAQIDNGQVATNKVGGDGEFFWGTDEDAKKNLAFGVDALKKITLDAIDDAQLNYEALEGIPVDQRSALTAFSADEQAIGLRLLKGLVTAYQADMAAVTFKMVDRLGNDDGQSYDALLAGVKPGTKEILFALAGLASLDLKKPQERFRFIKRVTHELAHAVAIGEVGSPLTHLGSLPGFSGNDGQSRAIEVVSLLAARVFTILDNDRPEAKVSRALITVVQPVNQAGAPIGDTGLPLISGQGQRQAFSLTVEDDTIVSAVPDANLALLGGPISPTLSNFTVSSVTLGSYPVNFSVTARSTGLVTKTVVNLNLISLAPQRTVVHAYYAYIGGIWNAFFKLVTDNWSTVGYTLQGAAFATYTNPTSICPNSLARFIDGNSKWRYGAAVGKPQTGFIGYVCAANYGGLILYSEFRDPNGAYQVLPDTTSATGYTKINVIGYW